MQVMFVLERLLQTSVHKLKKQKRDGSRRNPNYHSIIGGPYIRYEYLLSRLDQPSGRHSWPEWSTLLARARARNVNLLDVLHKKSCTAFAEAARWSCREGPGSAGME